MDLDEHRFSACRRAAKQLLRILLIAGSLETASPIRRQQLRNRFDHPSRRFGRAGNGEASVAWKKLAENEAATLLPILDAMDGANDYALNWLRVAIESIAERELKAGKALPIPDLGNFLLDARHHPRARRLAFELIARVDPGTTDKLLGGMLNDPSLEIRYDAVQKVIGQASQSLSSSNRPAQRCCSNRRWQPPATQAGG